MPQPKLPLKGSCRCGRLEIEMRQTPIATAACHFHGCQKMSGSAFSLTAMVPAEGFAVTRGEAVIGGLHGDDIQHFFCAHCMSWVFTRPVGYPFVNVRPTMLDDVAWFRPFFETYASTKLPFVETGAVKSFAEFPAMQDYQALLGDYQAWAAA